MGERAERASRPQRQLPTEAFEDLEWLATDAILNANLKTTQILEQYLLQQHYREDRPNYDAIERQISETIAEHERIIEDLETARIALREAER